MREKIVIMLVSCKKNKHKIDIIKKTWLNTINIPYFILIGNPYMNDNYNYDKLTHILELKCLDNYENLNSKIYYGIKAINSEINPSGILKIDDDVLIRNNKLYEFINNPNKSDYEGDIAKNVGHWSDYHINKCGIKEKVYIPNIKYCRGPIYYISKKSIDIICNKMNYKEHLYEDVLIGIYLNRNNIYIVHKTFMKDFIDEFLNDETILGLHDIYSKYNLIEIENKYNINSINSINYILVLILIIIFIISLFLYYFSILK